MIKLTLPQDVDKFKTLKIGDSVLLSGIVYTARDEAHLELIHLLKNGEKLPIELKNQTIYYAGPCPTPVGKPSNSCGPTTSARMDRLTKPLLDAGLIGIIGKGDRSKEVTEQIKSHGAVYFVAVGGAGALYGKAIVKNECVAFEELGCEAIYRLEIVDFPVIVSIM